MTSSSQLPLSFSFREDFLFENFLPGQNALTVGVLRQALARLDTHLIYLFGATASGVTHLLQASVHDLQTQGLNVMYLPLYECKELGAEIIDALGSYDAVAFDDLEFIADQPEWQERLFHFYNVAKDSGKFLLVGAKSNPKHLGLQLQDLTSRLSSGLALQVLPMDDEERMDWLIWKGRKRGLVIDAEVAKFLILRHNQNLQSLNATFDVLDKASLSEQRRLTIPFVKKVLAI